MDRAKIDFRGIRRLGRRSLWEYAFIFAIIGLVIAVMLKLAG